MEFVIGNAVNNKAPLNKYAIEVSLMHGDADLYTKGTVLIDASHTDKLTYLEELVTLLSQLNNIPSGYSERYDQNPLFCKWFGGEGEGLTDEEYEIFSKAIGTFDWSGDKTCDGMRPAQYDGHKIYYYNEAGIKHNVKVVK